jgi:CheY-like chemotaxis protein
MPGIDGIETMRHMHRLRPATPIIVIFRRPLPPDSGGEPDSLAMAIKLGAISSLPDPFGPHSCSRRSTRSIATLLPIAMPNAVRFSDQPIKPQIRKRAAGLS